MKVKDSKYGVAGIGSALLDFIVNVNDDFLSEMGLKKGDMHLVDEERSREIFGIIKDYDMEIAPGGSSANTLAGISALGGTGAFMGMVADDSNGNIYIDKTEQAGVDSFLVKGSGITGNAITFITPDNERTFATHLGASLLLSPDDVSPQVIADSAVLHLEGYLFEPENLRDVCFHAMKIASDNGVLISIDLADPALIGRIHNVFKEVVRDYADIVFVNETEALAYTGLEEDKALDELARQCSYAVVKLGEKGSLIKYAGETVIVPVCSTEVVNTNGAGDMYAAGILYGITEGMDSVSAGKLASYASSLVVASSGARYNGKIDVKSVL